MSNRSKPHSYSITSSARASSVSGTFEAERALGRGAPVIEIFPTVVLFDICNNVTQTGPGPFTGGKTSLGDRSPPDPGRNAMGPAAHYLISVAICPSRSPSMDACNARRS